MSWTPWYHMDCSLLGSSALSDKNPGVSSLSLLQGIFLTQGSNPGLLHCRQILYHLTQQGSPKKIWINLPNHSQLPITTNPHTIARLKAGGRGRWHPTRWDWKAGSQSVSTGPQWNKSHPPPALHPQSSPLFFTLSFQRTSSQNFPTHAANRTLVCILRLCLMPIWLNLCGPLLAITKYTCNFQKWAEPRKPKGNEEEKVFLLPEYGISQL